MGSIVSSAWCIDHAFGARLLDMFVIFPLSNTGTLMALSRVFRSSVGQSLVFDVRVFLRSFRSVGRFLTSNPYKSYCGVCMYVFLSMRSLGPTPRSFPSDTCTLLVPPLGLPKGSGTDLVGSTSSVCVQPSFQHLPRVRTRRRCALGRLVKRLRYVVHQLVVSKTTRQHLKIRPPSPSDLAGGSRPPSSRFV